MLYNFFHKKPSGANFSNGAIAYPNKSGIKSKIISNHPPSDLACVAKGFDRTQKLAEELQNSIIRKFEKRKVCSSFKTIFLVLILWICN